jgi:hypothetical protein
MLHLRDCDLKNFLLREVWYSLRPILLVTNLVQIVLNKRQVIWVGGSITITFPFGHSCLYPGCYHRHRESI